MIVGLVSELLGFCWYFGDILSGFEGLEGNGGKIFRMEGGREHGVEHLLRRYFLMCVWCVSFGGKLVSCLLVWLVN